MAEIRHIHIKNFRVIKELVWLPNPGLNCLIGPGDSGKSTVLEAIDLALGARRSFPFSDADFHELNVKQPIEIWVTLGALNDELKNLDSYGMFLRSFDPVSGNITDEPQVNEETVLTMKLSVGADLDPDWHLYSERANENGFEKRLVWKHRELITPIRLGSTSNQHLAWGSHSVLNKLTEGDFDTKSMLAELGRGARESFSGQKIENIDSVLTQVKTVANNLGVPVGDLKALLDVKSVSFSNGAISLHDDNTPLRQLGTGSSRLLISGLQKAANNSNLLIIDEAEYGLEPFRISRLLNELGSKSQQPEQQVFITTHSPYVLRELQANQLHVIRKTKVAPFPPPNSHLSHMVYSLEGTDDQQSTLRVCAEAFFSKSVIVCEGKTEIGLIRGIDLYCQEQNNMSIQAYGTYCADGGGDDMFKRAHVFKQLGYRTSIFKDSDKAADHIKPTAEAQKNGITIFEWGNNCATEDVLFASSPKQVIPELIDLAIKRKGRESIDSNIQNFSNNKLSLDSVLTNFDDTMRPALSKVSNKKSWFKDIEPAEQIGKLIVMPFYKDFSVQLTDPINNLFKWARHEG
ncbi:ATP-dependent nuclease [Marinicellulosiphila megalodicopiae]|uniref:ATP-dependent nuclease n=1 Tax=Marinicellulosiphila megalodicopiae TaxID=2724896 RepID=UPI003BB17E72